MPGMSFISCPAGMATPGIPFMSCPGGIAIPGMADMSCPAFGDRVLATDFLGGGEALAPALAVFAEAPFEATFFAAGFFACGFLTTGIFIPGMLIPGMLMFIWALAGPARTIPATVASRLNSSRFMPLLPSSGEPSRPASCPQPCGTGYGSGMPNRPAHLR